MILGNPSQASVDGFVIIPAVLVSAAFLTYDQVQTFFYYALILLYSLFRTKAWINEDFRFSRFNIYLTIALGIVFYFARYN